MRGPQRYSEWATHPSTKVPRRRVTVKLHPHRPREAGGVFAGFIIAGVAKGARKEAAKPRTNVAGEERRTGIGSDRHHASRATVRRNRAPKAARARKCDGVRGGAPAAAWQALARASAPGRRHANGPPPADRGAKAQGGKSRARAAPPLAGTIPEGRPPITLAAAAPPHYARYLARRAPFPRWIQYRGGRRERGFGGNGAAGGCGICARGGGPGAPRGWP